MLAIEKTAVELDERPVKKQQVFEAPYSTPLSALAFAITIAVSGFSEIASLMVVLSDPFSWSGGLAAIGALTVIWFLAGIMWLFNLRRFRLIKEEWALVALHSFVLANLAFWLVTDNFIPVLGVAMKPLVFWVVWGILFGLYFVRVWRSALEFRAEQATR